MISKKKQCRLDDRDEAMHGLEQKSQQELRTIRNFDRELTDKNTAFAEENKSFSVQLEQKEKYIDSLKTKILGMSKNDPINTEQSPPVRV